MSLRITALLLAVSLVTAGCGNSEITVSAPSPEKVTAENINKLVENSDAELTLLHLWASWCPPCVREFPHLVKLAQKYDDKELNVIFVSVDQESRSNKLRRFLSKHGVTRKTYLAIDKDSTFTRKIFSKWRGAIPVSLFYGQNKSVVEWWEGARSYSTYKTTVEKFLDLE
jgi:thiol-disulfide isomerase/thioredoxin